MNGGRKSDGPIVPGKPANNGGAKAQSAEQVEGRGPTKGNASPQNRGRTQKRATLQNALARVRERAKKEKELRFTTLWHHVYDIDRLREAYFGVRRSSAAGVDGETWQAYGHDLERNLADLSARLRRGAYRAKPVRRVHIPKGDGQQRPLGIPSLEDKIVQRATAEVLNAIYENDFLGFSYGFRPGRSAHDALDAVVIGLERKKVNWVLDADIRGFFDSMTHEWLEKFVGHRIADKRVVRHLKKWLNAGVLEDGHLKHSKSGSPQGGSISPLLGNIYLHYVLDLWAQQWRRRQSGGDMIIVRYADDFLVGFEHRQDAERFLAELAERFRHFGLELHPDKTRLIEFGRFAAERRDKRGAGKPETFDFLGFTHYVGKTKDGHFRVKRRTAGRRLRAKLKDIGRELRRRSHLPIPEQGRWLRSVLLGWYRYFAVPLNSDALSRFRHHVCGRWIRALRRRSQRHRMTWSRFERACTKWLPRPRIMHPYPSERLAVITRGRSPVR